jgi:hypothetical protein
MALTPATASAAGAQSYVTIMFSRGQVQGVTAPSCTPMPNGVTIWQVAADLAARGYPATEAISTSLVADTTEQCNSNGDRTLSWDDLHTLQTTYGWDVIPRGNTEDINASPDQQYADSCALLPTFYSEGFPKAWAMYAYFGGPYSATMQADIVSGCYGFGRAYRSTANSLPIPSPYKGNVFSINGGNCVNTTLPCAGYGAPYPYTQPSELQALVNSGGWAAIQGYKFVTGSYSSSKVSWDCTGADPSSHWSSRSEVYCYGDWLSVIDSIPATAQVVSPSVVAEAQGRVFAGPLSSIALVPGAATIMSGGTQVFRAEGYDDQGHDLGDVSSETTFSIDGSGSCAGNGCTATDLGTYVVTATHGDATATAQLTVVDPPTLTGMSPTAGRVGDTIIISGSGLDGVTGVGFNGTAAVFTTLSPDQIQAVVPNGATSGPVTVALLGGSLEVPTPFSVAPRIDGFTPLTGSAGTSVTISGSAFLGATDVSFAGTAASFTVQSYSRIVAVAPVGAASGPITVTTPDGTATSVAAFGIAPSISAFTPAKATVGTSVTITGASLSGASAVKFNGAAATFAVTSPTGIVAVVPAAASSGKISVTVAGTTVKSRATFYVLPTITGFSPGSGRVGTVVTITGTGFTNATRVLFAGVAAVYKVVSPTQIQATVPSGTKSGKITVRTAGGSATSAVGFTLLH